MSHLLLLMIFYLFNRNNARILPVSNNEITSNTFFDTLRQIYEEEPFRNVFYLGRTTKTCFSNRELAERVQIPLIIATADTFDDDKLKDRFNSNILAIVCLSTKHLDLELLNVLSAKLQHRRQTRITLYFAAGKPSASLLASLSVYFEKRYMTNVIGLYDDLQTRSQAVFYRYYPFPTGHWNLEFINSTLYYIPYYETNLQGKTFITLPDQILPRSLIYVNSSGHQQLSGYVGLLLSTFAAKYNATLKYLYPVIQGDMVHLTVIFDYVVNGTLDLAIALTTASFNLSRVYPLLSYPLELSGWFIMLPCPQPLDYSDIYTIVVNTQVIGLLMLFNFVFSVLDSIIKQQFYKRSDDIKWIDILVNENIFRGIFGLSFLTKRHPVLSMKMLYVFLFPLGLFVNNMYSAYFQTLFTSPPLQQKILTFDDMRARKLMIMFDRNEIKLAMDGLGSDFNRTFKDILLLEHTEVVQRHRREYDTMYAYTIPEALWSIFEAQQENFERELYCLAPTLKFFGLLMLGIPLAENSNLMEPLNKMILRVIETGLLEHWRTITFINMRASGQLPLKGVLDREQFHDITIEDIQWPFYLLLCGSLLSTIVFVGERYLFKQKENINN
ncbi:uncharacterized protein LOC128922574 [Zeugodacus cucurbitae]|uniref:uncharacterized protein LOC128922574 n=1 Tax=Zeugodacus cucurbitae TaxID=28588 RepID=UPI0023D94B4C|nr:uncharacterized protein LOC128922574 [Zeugodacus cucurbitae]